MAEYDNYIQTRMLWLEAEKNYAKSVLECRKNDQRRQELYRSLEIWAAKLSEEEKQLVIKEQFGDRSSKV